MSDRHLFLALDLGAESGRAELVTLAGGKVSMEEIHRWPNRPVRMAGTLHWDAPYLLGEIYAGLKIAAARGAAIEGISVDTWGVDFGLLGADGRLLGNPVHYRDSRTDKIHEYSNRFMSTDRIFELTAYEPWAIASLFQLLAMQRDGWPALGAAEAFLNMPDLFHYFLTGVKASEMSIANTSNLMGTDCRWSEEIVNNFNLPRRLLHRLIPPATVLGPLSAQVRELTALGEVPVVATCGHDTSAAVAAVPGQGPSWAFLSSGTWSILGALTEAPVTSRRCLELGFTNEYTIGGWYIARNILGLWLVQELKRKWDTSSDKWDYAKLTALAAEAPSGPLIDASEASLMAPADMESALLALLASTGQAQPSGRGQLVRSVLESLALEYALRLRTLAELTGRRYEALYIVGGGIHNKLLCQFTANACGMPVHAGADQCTALGNALGQALALGILRSRDEIRQVMRDSSQMTSYEPREQAAWQDKIARYDKLKPRR
jgi:rhamnulokinase